VLSSRRNDDAVLFAFGGLLFTLKFADFKLEFADFIFGLLSVADQLANFIP
jgi:hypothetical protein